MKQVRSSPSAASLSGMGSSHFRRVLTTYRQIGALRVVFGSSGVSDIGQTAVSRSGLDEVSFGSGAGRSQRGGMSAVAGGHDPALTPVEKHRSRPTSRACPPPSKAATVTAMERASLSTTSTEIASVWPSTYPRLLARDLPRHARVTVAKQAAGPRPAPAGGPTPTVPRTGRC